MKSDALDALRSLNTAIADIVFLDPPFNLGKKYGDKRSSDDSLPVETYVKYMCDIFEESARLMKPGGSLFLYHIPRWAVRFAPVLSERLDFQHWIAIGMKNGFARPRRLYPAHYALLHFSNGPMTHFSRPKIPPLTCPHCGEYVRSYGGYSEFVKGGVNLSDIWDDVSPVRHARYKLRKANELPPMIPHRVVQMTGRRGGVLVDPFSGTGTSLVAARLHGMKYVGIDNDTEAIRIVKERLVEVK